MGRGPQLFFFFRQPHPGKVLWRAPELSVPTPLKFLSKRAHSSSHGVTQAFRLGSSNSAAWTAFCSQHPLLTRKPLPWVTHCRSTLVPSHPANHTPCQDPVGLLRAQREGTLNEVRTNARLSLLTLGARSVESWSMCASLPPVPDECTASLAPLLGGAAFATSRAPAQHPAWAARGAQQASCSKCFNWRESTCSMWSTPRGCLPEAIRFFGPAQARNQISTQLRVVEEKTNPSGCPQYSFQRWSSSRKLVVPLVIATRDTWMASGGETRTPPSRQRNRSVANATSLENPRQPACT